MAISLVARIAAKITSVETTEIVYNENHISIICRYRRSMYESHWAQVGLQVSDDTDGKQAMQAASNFRNLRFEFLQSNVELRLKRKQVASNRSADETRTWR